MSVQRFKINALLKRAFTTDDKRPKTDGPHLTQGNTKSIWLKSIKNNVK